MSWIREHLIEWFCIISALVFVLAGADARASESVTYWTPDGAPTFLCVIIVEEETKEVTYVSCSKDEGNI